MNPAARCRFAIAMTALAAYGCGDQAADTTIVEAGAATTTDQHNPEAADPTYADWEGLARLTTTTQRASRSRPRPAGPSSTLPAGTGDTWARLAQCESGSNPRAVSSSGTYRGAFQFSLATWRSVGMNGDPIDHSYSEQLAAAQRLQARSGWGQWPACARKLGLL